MREIPASQITEAVARLCISACHQLPDDVMKALREAAKAEESPLGRELLAQLVENAEIAAAEQIPICQDTGVAVVFVELGREVCVVGGDLVEAINAGVSQGYREGYLRASMVSDPLLRENTGDNTPAVIHLDLIAGDQIRLMVAPKGAGSENMSRLTILKPSEGEEGVKRFVVETVKAAGANACPPLVVGVGLGGTSEKCAWLAKRAALRQIGTRHPHPHIACLEDELLALVNDTGIGPQGLGGRVTALAVNVETFPCHIASLPVGVNLQCHAARRAEVTL